MQQTGTYRWQLWFVSTASQYVIKMENRNFFGTCRVK